MDLELFKKNIENNIFNNDFYIFKYTDIDFLPNQYLKKIVSITSKDVLEVDDFSNIVMDKFDLFEENNTSIPIKVYRCKTFDIISKNIDTQSPSIVICNQVSKEAEEYYRDNIIVFPKLENWQIKDYVYSVADGVDEKDLDYFISLCQNDIYRISNELDKIRIFSFNERKYVFKDFITNGIFNDLSEYSIFNLTNSIMKKDIDSVASIYKEIERIDCEPLGLVTILINNIRNMIKVQMSKNATPESTHIKSNVFWALKHNIGKYTDEQLVRIFLFISSIDKMLKLGEITNDLIIDYVVCHIMGL